MANQPINLGTAPLGEDGDTVRAAFEKVNSNTSELYSTKANTTDSRLTDAREWTAETVPQAEAEAGTATTRRAWTAQRVREAIVAWWNSVSSAWGRALVSSTNAAAGRTALELGNAATSNITSTNFDSTWGRLVKVGDYGLGRLDNAQFVGVNQNPDDYRVSGFYVGQFNILGAYTSGFLAVHAGSSSSVCGQEFIGWDVNRKYFRVQRAGVWRPWREIFHAGNILGTVSQSGGVPTGAIIERGANANGQYVKFADGTMICERTDTAVLTTSQPVGAIYTSPTDIPYTFPAAFISAPSVIPFAQDIAGFSLGALANGVHANGIFNTRVFSVWENASTRFGYMAIGRWY